MHEVHLIKDLMEDLQRVAKQENVQKITKLYIAMGGLTEITPEVLKFNFTEKAKGTVAEGAVLVIEPSDKRELRLKSFDCD